MTTFPTVSIAKYTQLIEDMENPLTEIQKIQLSEHTYNISQAMYDLRDFVKDMPNNDDVNSLYNDLEKLEDNIMTIGDIRYDIDEFSLSNAKTILDSFYNLFNIHQIIVD